MLGINKIIKTLIISDFFLQSGWGLIGPIFALFLTGQIEGGTVQSVGFIAATYWIAKSAIQPFIAHYFDKKMGERDDFKFLVLGMYFANLVPLGYFFSTQIWHIIVLEAFRGLAMACVIPSWSAIFTKHIDKGREAFSWSIESTGLGIAAGFSAAFGAILAGFLGFKIVFLLVSAFGILSASNLFLMKKALLSSHGHSDLPILPKENPF